MSLLMRLFGECKFAGKCQESGNYDPKSETCIKTRGVYYQDGTRCRHYRILIEKQEEKEK